MPGRGQGPHGNRGEDHGQSADDRGKGGEGHDDDGDTDEGNGGGPAGSPCGAEPDDLHQVTTVRNLVAKACDCAGASNHGRYVSCVWRATVRAIRRGDLRPECSFKVVSCAARSACGKRDVVACCRTDATGRARCSLLHDAATCTRLGGCVAAQPSCCNACGPDGCLSGASTTTTTTRPPTTTSTASTSTSTSTTARPTTTTSASTTTTLPTTTTRSSTTTTSTTSTTTGPTATTTTTLAAVCGDGTVEAGETCDDGNTVDENDPSVPTTPPDTCPGTCRIESCAAGTTTPQDVSVSFSVPPGGEVAGITVFLDYPDAKTSIPGSGSGVGASIKNLPGGVLSSPNDLDYGLIEGVVSLSALTPGRLFSVTFQNCPGAPALAASDFHCVVKDASDTLGNTVAGVSCSVSIP